MSTDRLTALATLAVLEANDAPAGAIRETLLDVTRGLAKAIRMYEDVAAGGCPGCGRQFGMATAGCENPAGCGKRPTTSAFLDLLARPAKLDAPAPATAGQKAAATRAARKSAG